jgi:hypothetical protein
MQEVNAVSRSRDVSSSILPDAKSISRRIAGVLMFQGEISCRKRCPACAVHMPASALAWVWVRNLGHNGQKG